MFLKRFSNVRKIKAVIFDLDGVITDSAKYHFQAWKMLAGRLQIPFDESYNENLKGVSRMESLELLLKNGGMQNAFTAEEKEALAAEKNELYKELIKQITPADILPGVLEFIKELKLHNIKTAVASVSKNADFLLTQLQVKSYFDYVCDPAQIQNHKPDPEIFLVAAKGLGVDPANCIGIEDAEAGIQAINTAGMFSVGVGSAEKMTQAKLILTGTDRLRLSTIADASNMRY